MDLFERAQVWLTHDPDPAARAEIDSLVGRARSGDGAALSDLTERFSGPLEFGTAGLRGLLGGGESRMNRAVIRRTTYGLGKYLLATDEARTRKAGVAIGYDGRRMSREFAEDTAGVLASLGIPSHLSPGVCPTPVTAFAVDFLGAVAGVMVTASHNPPDYNGYKVYWSNGAQIIPPHDTGIAHAISQSPAADAVPVTPLDDAKARGLVIDFPVALEATYLARVQALSLSSAGDRTSPLVYTALHGVGDRLVRMTLERAGFTQVKSVPEQAEPDGRFPTVAFPNPEEKGALDLAFALAERENADLVIANDPDVDRLAAAERSPLSTGKSFVQFTGNQVGVLLGHYLLTRGPEVERPVVLASCVSSPMLGDIAAKLGVHYEETLTGFKWIANRAMELEKSDRMSFVFGYEEALGYTVGPLVRDKDGIGAALLLAELWAVLRAEKKTLGNELESIYRQYGLYVSGQVSLTMKGQDGLEQIHAIMKRLRSAPPARVGELGVVATSDVSTGVRTASDGATKKLTLPPSDVLIFDLEQQNRIIARPSGTEPKIKFYFDVREPIADGEPLALAEARASDKMEALKRAFTAIAQSGSPT